MRLIPATVAASFIGLGFMAGIAQAEAVKVSPELTVFTKESTASTSDGPTVLRGSATRRGTVHSDGSYAGNSRPFEINAGETLWLTDPETGLIIACEPRRTSRVGSRFVQCFD